MAYPGSKLYAMAIENRWELPRSWIGYSQHGYDTYPLRTNALTSAEVLRYRDAAFTQYFTNPSYLGMIRRKFGDKVLRHVEAMTGIGLKRRLLEETVPA
jgi:hypothetical protein